MNKRVFVKKKEGFQVESQELKEELHSNLHEVGIEKIDIYNIYDIFGCSEEDLLFLTKKIVVETVTDELLYTVDLNSKNYIAYENIPGQFDQRGESASQCLALLNGSSVKIKSGRLVVIQGFVLNLENVKRYLINPIEMREKNLFILDLPLEKSREDSGVISGFNKKNRFEIEIFRNQNSLTMRDDELLFIQSYFIKENREPSLTELKLIDTYWSDHCRHTTFETELVDIEIKGNSNIAKEIDKSLMKYLNMREELGITKPITLMDLATIGGKYAARNGNLKDLEISSENNACSIEIDVKNGLENEKWLLMFKNETHNHPTEIEPFGGASTCIGGAIRDPLSGRAYVYQAMRISGAADITEDIEDTLEGKLPQKVISTGAAKGYSSYGNQIGLATTFVSELYHPGYKAKRMEVGAVVGAVKKEWVRREEPLPGDLVILIGGATGRDGIGGATGSSKEGDELTLTSSSSEVQKGDAPMERRIQRLFRNREVIKLIKKSNDFGAGGVAVAIGEISRGVTVNLDLVPLKYSGLTGGEIALSESQERMAVVIDKEDLSKLQQFANLENVTATVVGEITDRERLEMFYKGEKIVDISREFLDTNGIRRAEKVVVRDTLVTVEKQDTKESQEKSPFSKSFNSIREMLYNENVQNNFGMVELFDSSVGRGTILAPLGGKYQLTHSEASVQKIPTENFTDSCSILTYGFNPSISSYSPYLGGIYAVVESLSRIVAVGGDFRGSRLTFQEYFERLGSDKEKWGRPLSSLLGALCATESFGTPAIGGKDSMSGTFKEINVPPTLISFGVKVANSRDIISSEFKEVDNYIYLIDYPVDCEGIPDLERIKESYILTTQEIKSGRIISASTVKFGGVAEAVIKMALGNGIGVSVTTEIDLLKIIPGALVVESNAPLDFGREIGRTIDSNTIEINSEEFTHCELKGILLERYSPIYKNSTHTSEEFIRKEELINTINTTLKPSLVLPRRAKVKVESPRVAIVVFPGTNSEYDSEKAFREAGGIVTTFVFNNLNSEEIIKSTQKLATLIDNCEIFMIPGGFSAGDEPDGSGKFIATILQNSEVAAAITRLLKREGLILGICNGFQALIKCGLLPYGDFNLVQEHSPTLFRNDINRHISKMVDTEVINNSSPWLSSFKVGERHTLPISHGEGKFVISEELAHELFSSGQVATTYGYRDNFNGSNYSIEGVTSRCGQIFGKMAHSERYEEGLFKNITGNKLQDIFKNGVDFFRGE